MWHGAKQLGFPAPDCKGGGGDGGTGRWQLLLQPFPTTETFLLSTVSMVSVSESWTEQKSWINTLAVKKRENNTDAFNWDRMGGQRLDGWWKGDEYNSLTKWVYGANESTNCETKRDQSWKHSFWTHNKMEGETAQREHVGNLQDQIQG